MPSAGRRRAIFWTVAGVLAAALLYYSLRGIEWREVGRIVAGADPVVLGLGAILGTSTLFLRALRWRILLNAVGQTSVATAFWATAAGYFGNNFLPARAGELVRTFIIRSRSRLPGSYVLATAIGERTVDAVSLVVIGTVALWVLPSPPDWLSRAEMPFAIAAVAGLAVIALAPALGRVISPRLQYLPIPRSLQGKLQIALENGIRGLQALHDAGRLVRFVSLTAIIWTLDAIGTTVVAGALGLHLPVSVAFLLLTGLGLASAVPSTPGYVGVYQFVAVTLLTPFGFSRTNAIAFILVAQAMSYVVVGIFGGLGILRYRRDRRSA